MLKFLACVLVSTIVLSVVAAVAIALNMLFYYHPVATFAVVCVGTILLMALGFYWEIKDV